MSSLMGRFIFLSGLTSLSPYFFPLLYFALPVFMKSLRLDWQEWLKLNIIIPQSPTNCKLKDVAHNWTTSQTLIDDAQPLNVGTQTINVGAHFNTTYELYNTEYWFSKCWWSLQQSMLALQHRKFHSNTEWPASECYTQTLNDQPLNVGTQNCWTQN